MVVFEEKFRCRYHDFNIARRRHFFRRSSRLGFYQDIFRYSCLIFNRRRRLYFYPRLEVESGGAILNNRAAAFAAAAAAYARCPDGYFSPLYGVDCDFLGFIATPTITLL